MKNFYIYIYIIIGTLIFSTEMAAQVMGERVRIHGKTIDASTKKTLPYTSIRIMKTSNGCSSDNNGNFSFHTTLQDTLAISCIGIITFCLSCVGVFVGNKFGKKYEKWAQIVGGVILILIGLKSLIEGLI